MRIGMVLDRPFPPDDRVEKEALSLIEAGHQVFLLCFRHWNEAESENISGIQVQRVFMAKWLFNKLAALILVVPFYKRFWQKHMLYFVKQNHIEALHIHDLPLIDVALKAKKEYKIPVIADMHEDYADWIINAKHYSTLIGRIIRKLSHWKKYEKKCLQQVDNVIGVSLPLIDKMQTEHLLEPSKIIYVPNAPDLSRFLNPKTTELVTQTVTGKFNLIYAGGLDYLRGLQNILPQITKLKKKIKNIQLVIIGEGTYKNELQQLVSKLDIESQVYFTGWLQIDQLAAFLTASDIGLYPQLTYGSIEFTLPTKLYQYCACGIPVIANDHSLPREFLQTNECGYVVSFEKEHNDFIEKVSYLFQNETERLAMGQRGREAIIKNYDWNKTILPLINLYRELSL